jgi:hypothetical protein
MIKNIFFFLINLLPTLGLAQTYHVAVSANANKLYSTNINFQHRIVPGGAIWFGADYGPSSKYTRVSLRVQLGIQQLNFQPDIPNFNDKREVLYVGINALPTLKLRGGRSFHFGIAAQSPLKKLKDDLINRKTMHLDGSIGLQQAIRHFEIGLSARHSILPFQIEFPGTQFERNQYNRYLSLSLGYRF